MAHLPTWFKAKLRDASTGWTEHGTIRTSYQAVGQEIGGSLEYLFGFLPEEKEEQAAKEFEALWGEPGGPSVVDVSQMQKWLRRYLVGFYGAVPKGRRLSFTLGGLVQSRVTN